jgi:hypothetical protein
MRAARNAVLIELDRVERRGVRWRRVVITGLVALAVATVLGQQRPDRLGPPSSPAVVSAVPAVAVRAQPAALHLPQNAGDVQLTAFPDWLANEPPPAALRGVVAVRGTMGIASVEGVTVINWTEHGVSYRLESQTKSISDLVRIADSLR